MTSYEDDHNILPSDNMAEERAGQTLSTVIQTLLDTTLQVNGTAMNGREIFETALRMLDSGEGSSLILEYLQTLADISFKNHKGVDDEFLDSLDRVDVKTIAPNSECPICTNKFADHEYPLLVKLPCGVLNGSKKEHIFDLECIEPWLKMHSTCPLCRFDVLSASAARKKKLEEEIRLAREKEDEEEEIEEENWELYG